MFTYIFTCIIVLHFGSNSSSALCSFGVGEECEQIIIITKRAEDGVLLWPVKKEETNYPKNY